VAVTDTIQLQVEATAVGGEELGLSRKRLESFVGLIGLGVERVTGVDFGEYSMGGP